MLRDLLFSHIRKGVSIVLEQHTLLLTSQTAAKVRARKRKPGTMWPAIEEISVISSASCSLADPNYNAAGKGLGKSQDNLVLMNQIARVFNGNAQMKHSEMIKNALEPNRTDYDRVDCKE
ncbi:hypothetical protein TEQG_01572 [Trichophyton equinum CBS 127.97]|uniref:Uncharacterized protein n=1 Tax=Trichophyton equinum (strain ATCC MYA-4606 / CBS 127.97) TaxID=559882 RepID=F2PLH3_TRIEC|nr:hypothetical protein TEQG_01572 [Trichophyton equinum CBS 127.97]